MALCVPAVARAFAIQVAASFAESGGFEALAGEASYAAEGLTLAGDAEYDLSDGGLVTLVGAEGLGSRFGSTHSAYRPPRSDPRFGWNVIAGRAKPRDLTISSGQLGSQNGPNGLRDVGLLWGCSFRGALLGPVCFDIGAILSVHSRCSRYVGGLSFVVST